MILQVLVSGLNILSIGEEQLKGGNMKIYAGQEEISYTEPLFNLVSREEFTQTIIKFLEEELPECDTNNWFIQSVHLANMVDLLVDRLNKNYFGSKLCSS